MPAPYSVGGTEPAYIAPDPKDLDVFFSGGNNGLFLERLNRRTGESREVGPYPRIFSGEPSSALVERIQWTFPIVFSPVDPNVLYTATQHVWKTTNGGQDWERISGDLTRHDPKTMGDSGGPITHDMNSPEVYATVFAIGPGKTDANVIWAGSDDGLVHVTRDGGKTWTNVTPSDMPDFGRVSIIDASAFDAGIGLRGGEAAAARRLRALHLPDARLRQDVDEDRHGHRRRRLRARRPRGSDAQRPALRRHAARRLRVVRRRRPLAVAVAEPAGRARSSTSSSRRTTSSSPPTAAASTSSTTSARCASPAPDARASDAYLVQAERRDSIGCGRAGCSTSCESRRRP